MSRGARVVITDSELPSRGVEEEILEAAGLQVHRANARTPEEVVAVAHHADALLVQWAPITGEVLDALPSCRFISRYGIGVDMIDLEAATRRGVAVANTPDYCIGEVAVHTVALVLAQARSLVAHDRSIRSGEWQAVREPAVRPDATSVSVLGAGRIGARVARALVALGFRVLVHDPYVDDEAIVALGAEPIGLAEAFARADVLTLHVPLTPQTAGLVDAGAIASMPEGAIIVNTCRGGLVVERDLVAALAAGRLAGAALDVFADEPLPADSGLRQIDTVLLTPHAAWYSREALAELPRRTAQQAVDFLMGRPVSTVLNFRYQDRQPSRVTARGLEGAGPKGDVR